MSNDFAAQAREIMFTVEPDHPKQIWQDETIERLTALHEVALRQAEKDARIDELTRVSNHLSADSKDRFIDQDVYLWMWEVEYEDLNPDQSAFRSERQAGTGEE